MTGAMLFTDLKNGHVDLFGGFDGHFYQLDTWQWTGSNWKQLRPPIKPSARATAVIGTDFANHSTVLFGGLADVNPINTWTWTGATWAQRNPAQQPSWRFYTGAAYDEAQRGVVTFGGQSGGTVLNDTWEWNGTTWSPLRPRQSPPARASLGIVWDAAITTSSSLAATPRPIGCSTTPGSCRAELAALASGRGPGLVEGGNNFFGRLTTPRLLQQLTNPIGLSSRQRDTNAAQAFSPPELREGQRVLGHRGGHLGLVHEHVKVLLIGRDGSEDLAPDSE
jgi:hypothetical protein